MDFLQNINEPKSYYFFVNELILDMGMEGDRGLVAGRSQREKRRSYKDLLREEEEIAAQVRKTSKKRPKVSLLMSLFGYTVLMQSITAEMDSLLLMHNRIQNFSCWVGTRTKRRKGIVMTTITGVRGCTARKS